MFSYSPNFYQERLQRLVVRCISICHAVIRHLQGSKLTRDMMVMKAVTVWCCRVRSAAPEIQFPTEQRGSILYSFLLYPLHKIFSHLQNKKVRILESCVLTHLSTILSIMKYTCKDRLNCTVYVTNEHIAHQLILLFFFSLLAILLKVSKENRHLRCTLFC